MWGMEGCLVKVGGVVTEMYRTGHSHACSINLSAYCCRSCRGAHTEWRGALLLGRSCQIEQGLFRTDQRPASPIPFGTKNKNGMVSPFLWARSVSTVQWRHRSLTMSCLDVMYPAYGHYAPYAATAPAFINSLQVGGSEQMLSVPVVFLFTYKAEGSWGSLRWRLASFIRLVSSSLCVKSTKQLGKLRNVSVFVI